MNRIRDLRLSVSHAADLQFAQTDDPVCGCLSGPDPARGCGVRPRRERIDNELPSISLVVGSPRLVAAGRLCGSPFVHATPVVKRDRPNPKRDTPYLARLSPATGGVSGDDRVCAVTALSSLPDCVPVGGRPASALCSLHHMASDDLP